MLCPLHGTACCQPVPAAAEITGDRGYVQPPVGPHAHLIFLVPGLIQEKRRLDAFRDAQLLDDPAQIFRCDLVEIHLLSADRADDHPAVQDQDAFQQSPSQNLVFMVAYAEEGIIRDLCEIDPGIHQPAGYQNM